ncbi:MAG: hypothetical protein HZC44_07950 [Geobacter sp.]|nr:hypothetical protein [Geobacter sp.]
MTYKLEIFGDDLIITGPGLDEQLVRQIEATLDPDTRSRVIGWKRTAQ